MARRGAVTPRYNPDTPSVANMVESVANVPPVIRGGRGAESGDVGMGAAADVVMVCMRTLTRSIGCPTMTQHNPPTAPGPIPAIAERI